jgi:hypothetical protein
MSPYAYCGNNPICGTDRSGKMSQTLLLSKWVGDADYLDDKFIADYNAWIHGVCLQQEQRNQVNDMNELSQALGLGVEFNIVNGDIVGSMNINVEHQKYTNSCAYACALALAKWFHTDQANYTEDQLIEYVSQYCKDNGIDQKGKFCPRKALAALFSYVGLDISQLNLFINDVPGYINAGIPLLAIIPFDPKKIIAHVVIVNGYNYDGDGDLSITLLNSGTSAMFSDFNIPSDQLNNMLRHTVGSRYFTSFYYFSVKKH